jgi:hypothetical protein
VAKHLAGLWQTERANGTYTVLAFCEDEKGFLLHVTKENDTQFGFLWRAGDASIDIEWPESNESWTYRRTSSTDGERDLLRIDFPGADSETFHYFGEAASCPGLTHRLNHLGSPEAFSRWAWSLRDGDEGHVPSVFLEGAVFEICMVLIGSLFAGEALARAVPSSREVMFGIALLPFFCLAVFREHYRDSIQWWLLCPSVRRIGAFLYVAVALLGMVVAARTNLYGFPLFEAILRTLTFSLIVLLCGWTAFRELRGSGRPRFEIIGI